MLTWNWITKLFEKKEKNHYSDKRVMYGALHGNKPSGSYNSKRGKRKIIK